MPVGKGQMQTFGMIIETYPYSGMEVGGNFYGFHYRIAKNI